MRNLIYVLIILVAVNNHIITASKCGCKTLRPCYDKMLQTLLDRDEAACIEDAAIGASTITIFLKALKQFCSGLISVNANHATYEERSLYEVIINKKNKGTKESEDEKPVIILDAGQSGSTESVAFALYLVEQLVACQEYQALIENVRWIILPSTNPDGQEYNRYSKMTWKKNLRPSEDQFSYGVDLTRNFDSQWSSCSRVDSGFSAIYPGPLPASENETIFVKDTLAKYKRETKVYVSIRGDGHAIMYPYGYTQTNPPSIGRLSKVAGEVTTRVNQRASGIHLFVNTSIYDYAGKAHCGHSVDYAFDLGIPLAFEMRVFLGSDNRIISKFQSLPRGYESSLRNGYFSGIRELYTVVTNEKKYGRII